MNELYGNYICRGLHLSGYHVIILISVVLGLQREERVFWTGDGKSNERFVLYIKCDIYLVCARASVLERSFPILDSALLHKWDAFRISQLLYKSLFFNRIPGYFKWILSSSSSFVAHCSSVFLICNIPSIPWLKKKKIIWVIGVMRRTVVSH